MGTYSDQLQAPIRPVQIYLEMTAPPMRGNRAQVHYFETGQYKKLIVENIRSTYFDKLVVSSVRESLPATQDPFAPFSSARNVGRNFLYAFRRTVFSAAGPVTLSTPVLDFRQMEPNNLAHLLLDIVPYYYLARDAVGSEVKAVFRSVREPFRSWLNLFNVSFICENRRINGQAVKIRGTRGLSVHEISTAFDCNGIQFVPNAYSTMNFSGDVQYDKIFLARRAPRNLQNQAEVDEIIAGFGYEKIFMEDYSLRDQMSLAAQAKHVVALHGAAMSLLLLNSKMDSVVEIFPPHVYHQMYPACLGQRVGRYEQIIPDFDCRVAHSGWDAILYYKNRPFSIDTHLLQALLAEIHE